MKAVLVRTVSAPSLSSSSSTDVHHSLAQHMKCSLHLENKSKSRTIRRTMSEVQVVAATPQRTFRTRSRSFPTRIPEENEVVYSEQLVLERNSSDLERLGLIWRKSEGVKEEEEEEEISGGGIGKGRNVGGGDDSGYGDEYYKGRNEEMSDHYEKLLKADPGNSLVLRNYGRFLHEVKKDFVKAEVCYERAILASPGDGEVLSQYGKLIWESHRDEHKAESYINQAVQASPDDCYVMGSYASFLWDAEEDDEYEEETNQVQLKASGAAALVEAC